LFIHDKMWQKTIRISFAKNNRKKEKKAIF
jgi:hypothetical protein